MTRSKLFLSDLVTINIHVTDSHMKQFVQPHLTHINYFPALFTKTNPISYKFAVMFLTSLVVGEKIILISDIHAPMQMCFACSCKLNDRTRKISRIFFNGVYSRIIKCVHIFFKGDL